MEIFGEFPSKEIKSHRLNPYNNLSSMSFSSGDARYSCLTLINTLFKLIKYSSNNGY